MSVKYFDAAKQKYSQKLLEKIC